MATNVATGEAISKPSNVALAPAAPMREISGNQIVAGATAMAYGLDQFISDCRSMLSRDGGPQGREAVCAQPELSPRAHSRRVVCDQDAACAGVRKDSA